MRSSLVLIFLLISTAASAEKKSGHANTEKNGTAPGSLFKSILAKFTEKPHSCNPENPNEKSSEFVPTVPIVFAWVTRGKAGLALSKLGEAGAECVPLVYDVAAGAIPLLLGELCSEEKIVSKTRNPDDLPLEEREKIQEELHGEDADATFLSAKDCGMTKSPSKFFAQLWSGGMKVLVKMALPCFKQIDEHTRARACFEDSKGLMRNQYLDAIVEKVLGMIENVAGTAAAEATRERVEPLLENAGHVIGFLNETVNKLQAWQQNKVKKEMFPQGEPLNPDSGEGSVAYGKSDNRDRRS